MTHGGYLRDVAAGKLGDILQIGTSENGRDLAQWRRMHGRGAQPAVAIASAGLDFPLPASLAAHAQPVHIFTSDAAPPERIRGWEDSGYPVHLAGSGETVEGRPLVTALGRMGYERLYLLTGPKMLEATLRDRVLSRLYLTMTHQVLGGRQFHTLVSGPLVGETGRMGLRSLYYDSSAPKGAGQWFCCFDIAEGRLCPSR